MAGKFSAVAANECSRDWEALISRQTPIYRRDDDIRSPFARDYTRVLHSLAYRRLKHKTQVFFAGAGNDHICTRIEHVAHVESVASTIAMSLGLNEELVKAMALAHDLGHAPFGHQGEGILNKIAHDNIYPDSAEDEKVFWHEKNGVYFVDKVELLPDNEAKLRNLNLTYAVRDGIISHCGELDKNRLFPRKEFIDLEDFTKPGQYEAVTWEGCVVKLADKIAYLGRDIEDAKLLGYFSPEQEKMLEEMAGRCGNQKAINTTVIMHNMIIDLCSNSSPEEGLGLSSGMSEMMNEIKKFNYENIYKNPRLMPFQKYSELVLNSIFERLAKLFCGADTLRQTADRNYYGLRFVEYFIEWLAQYCEEEAVVKNDRFAGIARSCINEKIYGNLEKRELYLQAVIDFIAGMTDNFAIEAFEELLKC